MLGSITSVQVGGALATRLFASVGPAGAVLLRLGFATVVLGLATRPRLTGRGRRPVALVVAFGLVLAAMNLAFYQAIDRIPLGIAVTVEFVGPLAVALGGSRRWLDVVWAVLAAGGVGLLTSGGGGVHLTGTLLALAAGACWAGYILLSKAVGRAYPGTGGLALAMGVGMLAVLPWGVVAGAGNLGRPGVVATGFGVAMLSSAVPYSLELAALRRLPAPVFGVLMSLEPGVAALAGFAILGQGLGLRSVAALAMVSLASVGSTLVHRRAGEPPARRRTRSAPPKVGRPQGSEQPVPEVPR